MLSASLLLGGRGHPHPFMQVLCKSEGFAWLAFDALSPGSGFAGGLSCMTPCAKSLEVVEVVRATSCDVEDVVDLQALGASALNTLIAVAVEDAFPGGSGDVRAIAISPH